jgi:hypothetical protein
LEKPILLVGRRVRLKDGTQQTLTFGKVDAADVILSIAGKPDPYKIEKYVYESITKDLKKKEEEKKDEQKEGVSAPAPAPAPEPPTPTPAKDLLDQLPVSPPVVTPTPPDRKSVV